MLTTCDIEEMKFITEDFAPSDARELVNTILDRYSNFYKLQYITQWEKDHGTDKASFDNKVNEIQEQKKQLNEIIALARQEGKSVQVEGKIELTIV